MHCTYCNLLLRQESFYHFILITLDEKTQSTKWPYKKKKKKDNIFLHARLEMSSKGTKKFYEDIKNAQSKWKY